MMTMQLLNYLLEASVFILLVYVVYRLFLQQYRHFQFNRIFILAALGMSILLPYIEFPVEQSLVPAMPVFSLSETVVSEIQEEESSFAFWLNGYSILNTLYWLGVSVMSLRLILQLSRLWQKKRALPTEKREGFLLIYTNGTLPTFSFFKWLFWDNSQHLTDNERELILAHEKTHIRQWHSADIIALELFKIAFWFHPGVYAFQKAQRATHEYLADAAALQQGSTDVYIRLLTHSLLKKLNISVAQSFYQSPLKTRIQMLRISKTTKPVIWKAVASIASVTVLVLLYACRNQDGLTPANDVATKVDVMPVYKGGTDALFQELAKQIRYPLSARKAGIQGEVMVSYTITKEGKLENIEIVKGVQSDIDQEVKRVLTGLTGSWSPGKNGNKAESVRISMPIRFVLNGEDQNTGTAKGEGLVVVGYSLKEKSTLSQEEAFVAVEHMPEFQGGFPALGIFLAENIKYPAESRNNKVTGTVFISFVVREDGTISNAEVVKGVNTEIDAEALRVANLMPKWTPGMQSGKKVPVRFTLPIKFSL